MRSESVEATLAGLVGGALVGGLLGLSATPLVATVLGAVIALLTGLTAAKANDAGWLDAIAARRTTEAPKTPAGGQTWRFIGFCLGALLVTPVAVIARTHGWLERSPADIAARWRAAGLPAQEAALVAAAQLGIERELLTPPVADRNAPKPPRSNPLEKTQPSPEPSRDAGADETLHEPPAGRPSAGATAHAPVKFRASQPSLGVLRGGKPEQCATVRDYVRNGKLDLAASTAGQYGWGAPPRQELQQWLDGILDQYCG